MLNVIILVAIVVGVGISTGLGFALERAGSPSFVAMCGGLTVIFAGFGAYRAHKDGVLRNWLRFRGGDFTIGFLGAGVLFACAYAFTRIVLQVGSPRESWLARLYLQFGDPEALSSHVSFVVFAIVVVAVAEEIVWRGLVTSIIEERVGSRYAWIYSAVLYSAALAPTSWALRDPVAGYNPVLPLGALAAGLLFGAMTRKFGRLVPAIFAHVLFDWTVVMMFRLWGPSI